MMETALTYAMIFSTACVVGSLFFMAWTIMRDLRKAKQDRDLTPPRK